MSDTATPNPLSPGPEPSEQQKASLRSIVNEVREIIQLSCHVNLQQEKLDQVLAQASALRKTMEHGSIDKALPLYRLDHGEALNEFLPYSPVSGYYNPLAAPVEMRIEADGERQKVVAEVAYRDAFEGPPNSLHGSFVAAVYDQVLAAANHVNAVPGPTAYLHIDYLKHTPLNKTLVFSAWIEKIDGRKVYTRGDCHCEGELISKSEGLFIRYVPRSEKERSILDPKQA